MTKIGIILGSTRPGRNGEAVAHWLLDIAKERTDAEFELIDLADYPLPHLDEAMPPSLHAYQNSHTLEWAAKIAEFDGYVFVTPEYNHSISGALKNALDYVYQEWNNKGAAFVGYGSVGGARAVEQLRLITAELQLAGVRASVHLSLLTDFENYSVFTPAERQTAAAHTMLDQLVAWSRALEPLRAGTDAGTAENAADADQAA